MKAKQITVFSFFLMVYFLLHIYIGWNMYVWLDRSLNINQAGPIGFSLILVLAFAFPAGQWLKHYTWLKIIGSLWLACFHFAVIVLPVVNIGVLLLSFWMNNTNALIPIAGALTLGLFFLYMGVGLFLAYSPVIRHHTVNLSGEKWNGNSFRMAVASDMHFGGLSGKRHARRLVKHINRLDADLILFPGDLVDDDPGIFKQQKMDQTLNRLRARKGIYAVTGNHEYYGKKIPELSRILDNVNVKLLQDDTVRLEETALIIGRKDRTDRNRKPLKELLTERDTSLPLIVMDHQPSAVKEVQEADGDIVLSGHTHRGQIFPYQWVTNKIFELDWGYKQKESLHMFVSSGYGFWGPPIRIGTRSEILSIDVRVNGQ